MSSQTACPQQKIAGHYFRIENSQEERLAHVMNPPGVVLALAISTPCLVTLSRLPRRYRKRIPCPDRLFSLAMRPEYGM